MTATDANEHFPFWFAPPPVYAGGVLDQLTQQLNRAEDLEAAQIAGALTELMTETVAVATKAEFLTALARKGETLAEIAAFATELLNRSVPVPLDAETRAREILDVCGTGGDHLGTFNISTTVAIVCAAAGVTVAKHGNRAVTSKTGSADVLESLGIRIDLSPTEAAAALRDHGFAFLFAPHYHPDFKHIIPIRKLCAAQGQRTIFNFLGPLLNPARPTAQLLGVPKPELCAPLARALQLLGLRRAMVVSGAVPDPTAPTDDPEFGVRSLDEISTLGLSTVAEFYQERAFTTSQLDPAQFPLQPVAFTDLSGGDRDANAEIIRQILRGQDRGPRADAVKLNAGAALFVAGRVRSISDGWELTEALINDGRAWAKLEQLRSQ